MRTELVIQICWSISLITATHFYGGTITWKPMNNTATGSKIPIMFTQSYQWKRSFVYMGQTAYCDQTIIINQAPLIPYSTQNLTCISGSCSNNNYVSIPVNEYCADFSILHDASSGQISAIQNITAGAKFCVAFQDGKWVPVYSSYCAGGCWYSYADWSIGSCIDLTVRTDGSINTPPVVTLISPVKVPVNTITNIKIPIIDADDDYLKCRWSKKTGYRFDECGDVCQTVPGGTLNGNTCVLTFDSTGKTVGQYYAAALMVEDFLTSSSSTALSSVPIQFLIYIVDTPVCPLKPTINSTLPDCVALQVGIQFSFTLNIFQGCSGTTVVDLFSIPPLYMYKGSLTPGGSSNTWTVTEAWIPTTMQLGSQVYCAIATDSANITSDQYCLTFFVVPAGHPLLCPGESTTTSTTTTTTTTTSATTTTVSTTSTTSTTTSSTTSDTTTTTSTSTSTTTSTSTSTTTSASTSTTSTTSVTTTTTTTVTTTQKKSEKKPIDLLPLLFAILGSLALCALCCCCWWYLFCAAAGRRRRRRHEKEQNDDKAFIFNKRNLARLSTSIFDHLKKPNRIPSFKPHDDLAFIPQGTTMTSLISTSYQNLSCAEHVSKTPRSNSEIFVNSALTKLSPSTERATVQITRVKRLLIKSKRHNRITTTIRSSKILPSVSNQQLNLSRTTVNSGNITVTKCRRIGKYSIEQ